MFSASIMGSPRWTGPSYFPVIRRSQQNLVTGGNPSLDFHHAFLPGSHQYRLAVRAPLAWDVDETLVAIPVYSRRWNEQRFVLCRLHRDVGGHVRLQKVGTLADIYRELVIHHTGDNRGLRRDAHNGAGKIACRVGIHREDDRIAGPYVRDVGLVHH